MRFDVVTLFPEMFVGPFDKSIVRRAINKQLVSVNLHDLRQWAVDERGTVDDRPYGGGVGMVLRPEPIEKAIQEATLSQSGQKLIILMDPRGEKFNQTMAREFSKLDQLVLVCGRYEGVDQRVADYLVDRSVSIGDYVLTGGEIPAMVIVDAVTRLVPGVLEKSEATLFESFSEELLEYPQYTRPEIFNGKKVPSVLLSGNHTEIEKWRREQSKNLKP